MRPRGGVAPRVGVPLAAALPPLYIRERRWRGEVRWSWTPPRSPTHPPPPNRLGGGTCLEGQVAPSLAAGA